MSEPRPASEEALRIRRYVRRAAFFLGVALLIWLPMENSSILWPLLFALAGSILGVVRALPPPPRTGGWRWLLYALAGMLAGLAVTPLAIFIMAFKSGLHGHGAPDFSPGQVISVINRTPWWVISGTLTGAGCGLMRKIKDSSLKPAQQQGDRPPL